MTMGPRKDAKRAKEIEESKYEDDEDYRKKRDRNNQAVKRSRVKSKQRTMETLDRVTKLKNENQILEDRVKTLTKELSFLKELFLLHASQKGTPLKPGELEKILSDDVKDSNSSDPSTSSKTT